MQNKEYVYIVKIYYSIDEFDTDELMFVYRDFDNARRKFIQLIEDECTDENSWVCTEALNECGQVNEDAFTLDTNITNKNERNYLFWDINDQNDGSRFIQMSLRATELL